MGKHSQSSSLQATIVGLGALAQRAVVGSPDHGRRRAEGSANTNIAPVMLRAGGAAAALALAVSGAAYAAVDASTKDVKPLSQSHTKLQAIGTPTTGATASTSGTMTVTGKTTTVTTVTEDTEDPFQQVKEESDTLAEGKTQVKTEGVNGVTRTTYQVTMVDGKEVSREAVSTVVVTPRVDEVTLVGTKKATSTSSSSSSSKAATAVAVPAGSAQEIAQSMMASYGWGSDQFTCLVSLWNRESNWNYLAQNSSSGAYGIPQALPGSKMASAGADWATNPATQIKWGLGYIAGRYGNPCGAWAHSQSTGWY